MPPTTDLLPYVTPVQAYPGWGLCVSMPVKHRHVHAHYWVFQGETPVCCYCVLQKVLICPQDTTTHQRHTAITVLEACLQH